MPTAYLNITVDTYVVGSTCNAIAIARSRSARQPSWPRKHRAIPRMAVAKASGEPVRKFPFVASPTTADMTWLNEIDRPIVLVSTSSERQNDAALGIAALQALADEPVHTVATFPCGVPDGIEIPTNATVAEVLPHGRLLERAVCAITHGGMGVTQKALARGVPVCVVPYGRDQFEVARRVEVSGCGTRLPARRLTAQRLKSAYRQALSMSGGARRVAEGFAAAGGVARGAELVETLLPPG